MSDKPPADPRPADPRPADPRPDVRPMVAVPRKGVPIWVLGAVMALLAIGLFSALEARRYAATAPATAPRAIDINGQPSSVPTLFIPPSLAREAPPETLVVDAQPPVPRRAMPQVLPQPPMGSPPRYIPPPPVDYPPPPAGPTDVPSGRPGGTVLVYDALAPAEGAPEAATARPSLFGERARASRLNRKATIVPQGALIPAVLETALDSSRPGFARAIVSRDVRSYDGTRVLIPRGSRLIGEYRSDATRGQKRALVTWTRLDRPDGATIALESPIADPAGRTGVRGRVNSHFFERFGAAFLQTALSIGENLALRSADSSVVVALPGSFQGGTASTNDENEIPPTIKVKQGTSITVFVARDLDFTGVESGR